MGPIDRTTSKTFRATLARPWIQARFTCATKADFEVANTANCDKFCFGKARLTPIGAGNSADNYFMDFDTVLVFVH